jgi:ribose/xylose/arabinose/galactoside ABC-type transport system permease subunit
MNNVIDLLKKNGIVIITVVLFIGLAVTTEGFFTERNLRNILDQQSTILIAASFMTIVIISCNFDISVRFTLVCFAC